jgi:hypothetical protein
MLFAISGCDEKKRQLSFEQMDREAQLGGLLVAVEEYQKSNGGQLPATLGITITNQIYTNYHYPLSEFNYSPNGTIQAEGKKWLISSTNPANPNELILGRLPYEVKILSVQTNSP